MHILGIITKKPNNRKRNKFLIIIGTVVIFIVATGIFVARHPTGTEPHLQELDEYIETPQVENEEGMLEDYDYIIPIDAEETPQERSERIERERMEFATSITIEQMIEDFDYMMAVLEENFPFFDLTYRRHGVDIREEAQRFRDELVNITWPINARLFKERLRTDFFNSIRGVGHIRTLSRYEYIGHMSSDMSSTVTPVTPWNTIFYERFTAHPSTSQFYGSFADYDFADAMEQFDMFMHEHDIFYVEIIEEGRIAYIRINTLFYVQEASKAILNEFYVQIADFDHLIIDIRGNTGSWPHAFHELITVPHLRRPVQLDIVSFYKGGENNLRLLDTLFDPRYNDSLERPSHFYSETFTLTDDRIDGRDGNPLLLGTQYLDWRDLDAFDYYSTGVFYTLYPSSSDGLQSNFDGQKWLLTDWTSSSGSEHVVALYKQENLAIIVGEQGSGVFMCPILLSNYFALPNTGIIIRYDIGYPVCRHTGHPLEEGIPPHFNNHPRMDALQTTLELIAEGV